MKYIDLEHNFFGRTDILKLLKRRVVDLKDGYRQNVALLGSPHVGKSSILKNFILNFEDECITSIYLDLENKDSQYVYSKFCGSLLFNHLQSKGLPVQEDLNLLLETAQKHIPQTVQVIKKVREDFAQRKLKDSFLGLLTLSEVYTNETSKYCILILDEFQNLEDILGEHAFQDLGKKIMTQKKCFYLFASSYKAAAQKILSEKLSLLFGNFEMIHVGTFDLKTSQEFIAHNLKDVKASVQLKHFLTDFTGGHPLYLNLVCKELMNLSAVYKQDEIYMPLLAQAVENTLFNRWGVISRHFELMINDLCYGKDNRVVSSILMALSNGQHKQEDIFENTGVNKTQIRQKMTRLMEQGIVVKNGQFHYLQDKLFKYWVKYVYQKRLKDVELSPDKQKKEFKEEFGRSMESIRLSSSRDFSSRVVDLLHCFDNESFDLNGRKYKLPVFREVVPFKLKNDGGASLDMIKAKTDDSWWVIALKKDSVVENDVNAIISESKQLGVKPDRCVIISLADLEENARLKALQEKFWIWNEGELNTLLTVFDKPYILK
ncbi:MAG: ATP-binding protein [Candidatus Omnitrophica bacterium]|nr:ATP-binding protein [Candidatus Omnitrophota bacterium]